MSEESSGSEIRLRCLSIVLNNCIGTDATKVETLAFLLRDDNIIKTKSERKALLVGDAIQNIISTVSASEDGVRYFVKALADEDMKMDERVSEILAAVFDEISTNDARTKLLSLWSVLASFHQDIIPVIKRMWPNKTNLTTDSWPLAFIHFCLTSPNENLNKIEDFVSAVAFLSPQVQAEVDTTDIPEASFPSESDSEQPHSFVILDKDEEGFVEGSLTSQPNTGPELNEPSNDKGRENNGDGGVSDSTLVITGTQDAEIEDAVPTIEDSSVTSVSVETLLTTYVSEESCIETSWGPPPPTFGNEEQNSARLQDISEGRTTDKLHNFTLPDEQDESRTKQNTATADSFTKLSHEASSSEKVENGKSSPTESASTGRGYSEAKTTDNVHGITGPDEQQDDENKPPIETPGSQKVENDISSPTESASTGTGDSEAKTADNVHGITGPDEQQDDENKPPIETPGDGIGGSTDSGNGVDDQIRGSQPQDRIAGDDFGDPDISNSTDSEHDEYEVNETDFEATNGTGEDENSTDHQTISPNFDGNGNQYDGKIDEAEEAHESMVLAHHMPERVAEMQSGLKTALQSPVILLKTPVTVPPSRSTTQSDEAIAERMQMEEVLQGSKVSSTRAKGETTVMQKILPTFGRRENVLAKIKFRVFIVPQHGKQHADAWWPGVKIGDGFFELFRHQLGYYLADIEIETSSKVKYRYVMMNHDRYRQEHLPRNAKERTIATGNEGTITHDVASFDLLAEGRWEKKVDLNIKRYLPPAKTVFTSDFWFPQRDVYHWLKSTAEGWRTDIANFVHTCRKSDIEQILKDWLASMEKDSKGNPEHVYKHVLCSLGVAVALHETKHSIDNPKLFLRICKGLQTHSLSSALQTQLFHKIIQHFQMSHSDIRKALDYLFENVAKFPTLSSLLTLPLYWYIYNDGDIVPRSSIVYPLLLFERALLPVIGEGKWETFRCKILGTPQKLRKLRKLSNEINSISLVHPRIIDTYHYFISADVLIGMIKEKHPLSDKFQVDSVFMQVLPLIEPLTFPKAPEKLAASRKKVVGLSTYLNAEFSRLMDPTFIQGMSKDEKVYKTKSACLIGERLRKTMSEVTVEKFDSSERTCLLWLITMACKSVDLYYKLGVMDLCEENPESFMNGILDMVKLRISEFTQSKNVVDVQEITFHNNLFNKRWANPEFQKKWIDDLAREIEKDAIGEQWCQPDDGISFLRFYLSELSDISLEEPLDSLLAKKADDSARDILMCYDPSTGHPTLLQELKEKSGDRLIKAFANAFAKEFEKFHRKGEQDMFNLHALQFLIKSPTALRFYRLFDRESITELFSKHAKNDIKRVNKAADDLYENFSKQDLTLQELHEVLQNEPQVKELIVLVEKQKPNSTVRDGNDKELLMLFATSRSRMAKYEIETLALRFFVSFCTSLTKQKIEVDCQRLKEIYGRKHSLLRQRDLNAILIEEKEMTEILLLFRLQESQIFCAKGNAIAIKYHDTVAKSKSVDDIWKTEFSFILNGIWKEIKIELLDFMKKVNEATLEPKTLMDEFQFTDGDEQKLKREVEILNRFSMAALKTSIDEKKMDTVASEKARQLAHVFKIQKSLEVLKWFEDFGKKHKLKGDFASIGKFQASFEGLDDGKFQNLQEILDIERRDLNVLKKFTEQEELIEWLRTSMEEERNVHGLCLVAKESTRYDPMQADKWSFLSDAVAGFDVLLFNLDTISSVKDLIARCKSVCKKVYDDERIISKWSDVGKDIAWYKQHEKWYGSEEKAALHFAAEANKCGIYTVGNFKNCSEAATLENSIKLEFSRKEIEATDQKIIEKMPNAPDNVNIGNLHKIQSTLALISSDHDDGKTEIKQFLALLTAMESLAKSYLGLVNAGFMLLGDWTAVAASSSKSKNTDMMTEHIMTLRITFQKEITSLSQTVSIQDVNLLSGILRDALTRWNNHLSRMRQRHYFLNEYSIQQIKYLCGHLGRIRRGAMEEQAYILLSNLPKNVMTPIIRESLNEAMRITDQEETSDGEETNDNADAVSEDVMEIRNKRRAVRHLVNIEHASETLAKAAVQANGHENLTRCCNWILLNEYDDDDLVLNLSREFDQSAGFVHLETEIQEDETVLQSRSAKTLEGMIGLLQQKAVKKGSDLLEAVKTIFKGYLSNTTALTLKDCLSVNHLGRFLTMLHRKMEERFPSPSRSLPHSFEKGKPNFILADNRETISLVLSLYASSSELPAKSGDGEEPTFVDPPGRNSTPPLPTPMEVQLCGEDTTADELERFMRRAICKHPNEAQLLFCLAFAENLDFNVSKALENSFDKLSHSDNKKTDYQLVIVSSNQHHYVSNCFDKYRLDKYQGLEENVIQSYVKQHAAVKSRLGKKKAKVVVSERSGVGKSLHVKRMIESLPESRQATTVRLLEKNICMKRVVERLNRQKNSPETPQLIHIDITPAVENGIEKFIFDLIISGQIKDSSGKVWRRNASHSYIIEVTKQPGSCRAFSHTLKLLPTTQCIDPVEVLQKIKNKEDHGNFLLMDEREYKSDAFQRPCQYLLRHEKKQDLSKFNFKEAKQQGRIRSNRVKCLNVLLRHCGMDNPSWAQLKHFLSFLDVQLINCEKSIFCQMHELRGLKALAVKFMIRMAQDFATPSLVISDESSGRAIVVPEESDVLQEHQVRRKWEESEHPYVFFNDDGVTMSFINVNINKFGHLCDKDGVVIEESITSSELVGGLRKQGIQLGHTFHSQTRKQMLQKLCLIMGIELPRDPSPKHTKKFDPDPYDPDPTYELTTDNVLKIIAIYMRFRCNIPVIIMGETGCGKTRMIEFMSRLQVGPEETQPEGSKAESGTTEAHMKTVKVHGGIGVEDIFSSVRESASQKAKRKVLFYDEANTTTAIYAIKEVMCDMTIDGEPFEMLNPDLEMNDGTKVQIVAACNPYRQLSAEALAKLESSGLGYRVATSETRDRLGTIAMRTLVYRVVALPPSIQPFVWDFGQLSEETEKIYIRKMIVSKLQKEFQLTNDKCEIIVYILSRAQAYMKNQQDECRSVSLRDVERSVKLFKWFHKHGEKIFKAMDEELHQNTGDKESHIKIEESLRCLIHAIGISYHVSLENRSGFREDISTALRERGIEVTHHDIKKEYTMCQTVFHRNLKSEDAIAWNEALCENVFLMAVCADLKLPLYLIGKPGSSKSLAKTIVEANMKGSSSNSVYLQKLKKVEVLSYQCSALTRASGIKQIFKDAVRRQKNEDLGKFTALVVLDEIGLAEDSPHMPLKILHSLLECGDAENGSLTQFEETEKVAFVGISNWALDPAKMNRGIFVTRSTPEKKDLFETARGIFCGNTGKVNENYTTLEDLTKTYLDIYKAQGDQYFGLRDYYCLIKMVRSMCEEKKQIDKQDIAYVLVRNFSGGKEQHVKALFQSVQKNLDLPQNHFSQTSLTKLVTDNIKSRDDRFLLLLTAHHSSINMLLHIIPAFVDNAQVIFGSCFPGDHTYTEICKNINRIKVCMEKGKLVILLNMTEIHESLYDVLNQHYVTFADQRYVAIGLGSHRVWSRVHEHFRLIVIEKRETVQRHYPIPLINRLEKHELLSKNLLNSEQSNAEKHLSNWSAEFSKVENFSISHAFIGHYEDTESSVVIAYDTASKDTHAKVMLQLATADSIYRLSKSGLSKEKEKLMQIYMEDQKHDCLYHLLLDAKSNLEKKLEILEIVSFSNILTEDVRKKIEIKLNLLPNSVMLLSLQQFKVEQEYTKKLDDFFARCYEVTQQQKEKINGENVAILLIQTAQAHANGKLIECAKHNFMNKLREFPEVGNNARKVVVAFLLSTGRCVQSNGDELIIQHTRNCKAVYVDELRHLESDASTTLISDFYNKSVSDILQDAVSLLETENSMQSHAVYLLKDCISEAMSKVTSSVGDDKRQIERVQMLQKICTGTGSALRQIDQEFLKILLQTMKSLLQSPSDTPKDVSAWITKEACSRENLQEGGTFGKTIHIFLRHRLADMLAFIVSIIDQNDNLSLLISTDKSMEWKFDLWLQLFNIIPLRSPSKAQLEYVVETVQHLNVDHTCKFPFSFVVNKKFLECFKASEETENKEEYFCNAIQKKHQTEISKVLLTWNSSNGKKMMEEYAHDLIKFEFKEGANGESEIDAMTKILFEYARKKWMQKDGKVNGVALTFFAFKEIGDHLSLLSSIFKIWPDITNNVATWIKTQDGVSEFSIHEFALDDLLCWTQKKAGEIDDEQKCIEWMSISPQMKKTYQNLVDTIKLDDRKAEFQEKWRPLSLLDMMLNRLLPWNKNDPDYPKYVKLVVVHAKRLFKAMESFSFYSKEILKIVTTIIRRSYDDLELSLIMQWKTPICVCGKRNLSPVQMPCGGFICSSCLTLIQSESPTCPLCTEPLPEEFRNTRPSPSPADHKRLENFRASCTGFFLEYLKEFCFKLPLEENQDDTEKITAIFFDTLVAQQLSNSKLSRKFKLETTKLDLNVEVRGNIFELLLKLQPSSVETALNRLLNGNFKDDILIMAALKGFENICADEAPEEVLDYSQVLLRESWDYLGQNTDKSLTCEILQHVAQVRYALRNLVKCVDQRHSAERKNEMAPTLVLTASNIMSLENSEMARKFVTKVGANLYGRQWLRQIWGIEQFKMLLSPDVIAQLNGGSPDYWEILGEPYKSVKSLASHPARLAKEAFGQHFSHNMDCLVLGDLPKIMAVLHAKNPTMLKLLKEKMRRSKTNILQKSEDLNKHLVSVPGLSAHLGQALYQLVLLATGAVLCKLPMAEQLHKIIENPVSTEEMYWPGMPELLYLEMNEAMLGEVPYSCPNGHVYYIGDCTYPWTMSHCPVQECGAPIGGNLHVAASGNQRLQRNNTSMCGYQLQRTPTGMDNPSDRITRQAAAVIQFFIHSCMIVALKEQRTQILKMIERQRSEDGYTFLAIKLQRNLIELARGLGCNVDDAILVLHQILSRMVKLEDKNGTREISPDWSTKEKRQAWEEEFRLRYLIPIFQTADEFIVEARQKVGQEDNLNRILLDDVTFTSRRERLTCFHPVLWRFLREPTAPHLLHCIADSNLAGGVLGTIVQTPNLQLVKHLENALKLQKKMIQRYQNKKDMKDVEKITFKQMLKGEQYEMAELIEDYINLWNTMVPMLSAKYQSKAILAQYLKKINKNTPIAMALPSARGRGRCAKLLAEELIDVQNDFLQNCKSADKSNDGIAKVEIGKLQPSHFVCVNKQHDLLPMIHHHTAYYITTDEQGHQHHIIKYHIAALEKQVKERHVVYKKMIKKESLPCIKYALDVGADWDRVEEHVNPQCPLPSSIVQEIDEKVQTATLADVCEGVRTLTQAISFLAKVEVPEAEASRKLRDYLEKDLMLSAPHLAMIPKSATIRHTLALYQKLSCHKAVKFVQQGLEPYKECLQDVEQGKITDRGVLRELKEAFQHMDLDSLQQHLNEMLIKTPDFEPRWNLVHILPELTFIEENPNDSWYSRIPEAVLFRHVADLFRLSVEGIHQ